MYIIIIESVNQLLKARMIVALILSNLLTIQMSVS